MSLQQFIPLMRDAQSAAQAAPLPVEIHHSAELPLDACYNCATAIALPAGSGNFWAAMFGPVKLHLAGFGAPRELDASRAGRQRSIFCCIGGKLMQCQRNGLRCGGWEQNDRPLC